ncbi:uncharacterized protein LOC129971257 [Argiope bruennichi]|uniref:uncharacterized protein LOC129971257 n=1 Tax=Argiope bruennichi TaxID=94029 RepID=UPI002493D418|nr:uncharacterized protein LOC129971257 [Argiope bruennichi]
MFPDKWKFAIIIPIPKSGKDPQEPSNYRPIALTSCLCKVFEKMVNARLVHILEEKEFISPFQSGFRKNRSTIDNLLALETDIRMAFIKRNHLVSVFFDINKAYDRAWRYGIMKNLYDLKFRGHLPLFIQNFLHQRYFKVRLGNTYSNVYCQEEGVPQGCILSVTLFVLALNPILSVVPASVSKTLYVDDMQISFYARDMRYIERQLQTAINNIVEWSNKHGFTFSPQKTVAMHLCKRPLHPEPELFLNGNLISIQDQHKFLGIILDKRFTFLPHITYLRSKCLKSLNILRVLSNTSWGAGARSSLLRVYRSIIRSTINYGCVIYGSAKQSYLKRLNVVHQALRLCIKAFRTSPVASLYAEASDPPLSNRRLKLSLFYFYHVLSNKRHPFHEKFQNDVNDRLFNSCKSYIPHLGLRIRRILPNDFTDIQIYADDSPNSAPWIENKLHYKDPLKQFRKSDTDSSVFISLFKHHREFYCSYEPIFTDGSKSPHHVGCAFVHGHRIISYKLHPFTSVFTSELTAIYLALKYIDEQQIHKSVIYTDSLSVLQALNSSSLGHPLLQEVKKIYRLLYLKNIRVLLSWIPSHMGISGNEIADTVAKSASVILPQRISYKDMRTAIIHWCHRQWQNQWDMETNNKLHFIKPQLANWCSKLSRRYDVILSRLRIGHTRLTHRFLLFAEPPLVCFNCGDILTIRHILIEYARFY